MTAVQNIMLKAALSAVALAGFATVSLAQAPPAPAADGAKPTPPADLPSAAMPGGEKKKKESSPCKKEVEAAFEKQRKASGFRMEASMVNTEAR